MGVYIKGMEMPTRCEDCGFLKVMYEPPRCGWTDTKVLGNGNARLNNCPLVPVPPHDGRLIDDLDIDFVMFEKKMAGEFDGVFITTLEKVNAAPTIIPAEEGE